MDYRETPPVNWFDCGPPGMVGYSDRKEAEMEQAHQDRKDGGPAIALPQSPEKVCRVCNKTLYSTHPYVTIHVWCEAEASEIVRLKRRPLKAH